MLKKLLIGLVIGLVFYTAWLVDDAPWGVKLVPPDAVMPDGSRYYGETENGFWHGKGEWVGADGSRYKGEFAGGLFSGHGQFWYRDEVYRGEFKKGMKHGHGLLTLSDGTVYSGDFRENEFYKGVYKDAFGNYVGEMQDGLFHGEGVFVSADGDRYEGTFSEHMLNGEGEVQYADGSQYKGGFEDWLYSGEGVLTTRDGDVYEGSFEFGEYHGQGRLTLAEPVGEVAVVEGEWQYGYLNDDPRRQRVDYSHQIEALLYSQEALINAAVADVEPSANDQINMFFVGVAGYGAQDVFLKEINTIVKQLESENIAKGRTLTLINHFDTSETRPLATATGIGMTLDALQKKMNAEEDILFLYLTSHGSKDHHFSIRLRGINLPDIGAQALAEILNNSPIKHKIVIISACYSGGFIDDLEGPDTLVITAAKKDRRSFGCGDESEMTYFGDAFFNQALRQADSFLEVFDLASQLVTEREDKEFPDALRSEPQISLGENIRQQLLLWERQRGPQVGSAALE